MVLLANTKEFATAGDARACRSRCQPGKHATRQLSPLRPAGRRRSPARRQSSGARAVGPTRAAAMAASAAARRARRTGSEPRARPSATRGRHRCDGATAACPAGRARGRSTPRSRCRRHRAVAWPAPRRGSGSSGVVSRPQSARGRAVLSGGEGVSSRPIAGRRAEARVLQFRLQFHRSFPSPCWSSPSIARRVASPPPGAAGAAEG